MSVRKSGFPVTLTLMFFLCFPTVRSAQAGKTEQTVRLFLAGVTVSRVHLSTILWTQPLSASLLKHRTYLDLRRLRNGIFAVRQGAFRSGDLTTFYSKQRWYRPRRAASRIRLNPQARANLVLIRTWENLAKAREEGRLQKSLLGNKARVSLRWGKTCFSYSRYKVIQSPSQLLVGYNQLKSTPCFVPSAGILYRLKRSEHGFRFRGLYKHFAILSRIGGSDYYDLRIVNLKTRKVTFQKNSIPPGEELHFDRLTAELLFEQGLRLPKACGGSLPTGFQKRLNACWSVVQKTYPILRKTTVPTCRCLGGLGPYISVRYSLKIDSAKPVPVMKNQLTCRCSS